MEVGECEMDMSGTQRLNALLFSGGRELANIKFFPGSKKGLAVDELHGAAADAIKSAFSGGIVNSPPMSGHAKTSLA